MLLQPYKNEHHFMPKFFASTRNWEIYFQDFWNDISLQRIWMTPFIN